VRLLQGQAFDNIFRAFERCAFHLEVEDSYHTPEESGPFAAFLAGESDDYEWHSSWLDLVQEVTKDGKRIERVRIVTVPHVDYTRWGLTIAPLNINAGEDVRWLPRHLTDGMDLTADDFWLIDNERVVFTVFEPGGKFSGGAETVDATIVDRCCRLRDRVWAAAIPHYDYTLTEWCSLANTVHQARETLGSRLRDVRKDAGLSGRQLAVLAGWHSSKVSKIEYGRQTPSEDDIRIWCRHGGTPDQVDDLIIAARDIEAMYVEWRRRLRTGTKARQEKSFAIESETRLLRWHEPLLVPGLLHTAEYATAVMERVIAFYDIPDDVAAGVAARMERQQILYGTKHRFHFVLAQQALRTTVGNREVMVGQLDRILSVMSLARVRLGVIPATAPYRVPSNQFIIFDERLVHVESISAEISVTQPREIALYVRAFDELAKAAAYGPSARDLIMAELHGRQPAS
jgi:transcriptional regulator with XRE-family HTH domain